MANAGAIKAGQAQVEITANNSKLVRALRDAEGRMGKFKAAIRSVGAAAAAYLSFAVLKSAAQSILSAADEVQNLADKTGLSVKTLSALKYAAGQSGASLDGLQEAMRFVAKEMAAGGDAFANYGIDVDKLRAMSPEDQFRTIADRVASITDPTERAGAAMALLGKGGQELLPMIAGGSAGLDAFRAKADALGITLSGEQVGAIDNLGDSLGTIAQQAVSVGAKFLNALMPYIQPVTDAFVGLLAGISRWADYAGPVIDWFAGIVQSVFPMTTDAISGVVGYLAGGELLSAFQLFATYLQTYVVDAALGAAVIFRQAWNTGFVQAIISGLSTAVEFGVNIWHDFQQAFLTVIAEISKAWHGFVAGFQVQLATIKGFMSGGIEGARSAAGEAVATQAGRLGTQYGTIDANRQAMSAAIEQRREQAIKESKAVAEGVAAAGDTVFDAAAQWNAKWKNNFANEVAAGLTTRNLNAVPGAPKLSDPAAMPAADTSKIATAAVGTFSARGAAGLAGNSDTAAIRIATRETARNTGTLAQRQASGGLAFT